MKSPVSFYRLQYLVLTPFLALLTIGVHAQVAPAGIARSGSLDIYAMYKYTNPDEIVSADHGISYGAEFKLRPIFHVQPGIMGRGENDFNWKFVKWDIYSGGPQFHFMPNYRLSPYAGVMFGLAHAHYRGGGSDTGTDLQPGVGATYRLTHRFAVIGDFQYHFVDMGTHNGIDTTFTPWSLNVGVQYKIF
jgi:hypothetical protein